MPWQVCPHCMEKDPGHEEGPVPPPACVLLQACSNSLFGDFCCDVGVSLGILLFFFLGLRQRKHKKGKNQRKKNPSLGCPALSKHRFASTPFKFQSLVLSIPFWGVTPSPASLLCFQFQQHKSLSLALLCEHPNLGPGWGCRALLCPELRSQLPGAGEELSSPHPCSDPATEHN